jgi:enterochelin esterase family protein
METWLERALAGTPVVDGETATFVWHGGEAPQLIGDFSDWEWGDSISLEQVAPQVWAHTMTLPRDAYIEYAFWQGGERVADPLNPHTTPDGLGHDNHYFYMPDAAPTPLTRRRRDVPHGTVTRHVVEEEFLLAGRNRVVYLYQPPTDEPAPLLVVLDGQDYRRRARITNIVDNLIAQGRMRPVALALPYHGRSARGVEYACSEAHLAVLVQLVLPLARKELNLLDVGAHPGAHGILGASMGGLMALYTGLRVPHIFGRVLSQSGAFTMDRHDTVVFDLVRHGPVHPLKTWMGAGRYEWHLNCNRRLHDLLVERGYDATYHEYPGGHNYPSWRDQLWRGLEILFPPE